MELEAVYGYLYQRGGERYEGAPPGMSVETPSSSIKAARGRGQDTLFVHLTLSSREAPTTALYRNIIEALIFFVIGFHLLEIVQIPFLGIHGQPSIKWKGTFAALMIGLVFGVALGPCTFAYLAPIIAIVFRLADTQALFSVSLILFYALGHCTVIVLAGTFTSIVQKYLNWNDRSKGAVILKKLCGALIVLGGIYIIFLTH